MEQKISIVIPTYNHLEDCLKPCLESIIKYTNLENVSVIIVANGCNDGTDEYVKSLGVPFKLVWFDKGLGYTKATNEGVKVSKGEYIVFLNNDTVLLEQEKNRWIDLLIEPLKDEKIGVTGPLMSYCPHAERKFLIFFCAATRREVFDQLGGLNEIYTPGGGEDTEFCIEAENLGYKLLQVPNEQLKSQDGMMIGSFPIYHKGEATMLDAENSESWYNVVKKNSEYLKNKYKLPEGWFFNEDIIEYRRLVNEVPDGGIIVELGCYKGRSICSVADIIKRKNLKVYIVDTFAGTVSEGSGDEDFLLEFAINTKKFGIYDQITAIKKKTSEAVNDSIFYDNMFDLLFVDADHEYEAVKEDIEAWECKVKGTIAGHDYNSHRGVNLAVDEKYKNCKVNATIWSYKL